jgi:hypothetical protein
VVHGVVSAVEPLAAEKRLAFKAEIAPGLPTGRGDGRRLSQVLLNLVGNAIKFTDKGEVAIRASTTTRLRLRYATPVPVSPQPIRPRSSRSSSKRIARSRARRAGPVSASRSPSASSRCTAVGFGCSPSWVRDRHSISGFRCGSKHKRGKDDKRISAHGRMRRLRDEALQLAQTG